MKNERIYVCLSTFTPGKNKVTVPQTKEKNK